MMNRLLTIAALLMLLTGCNTSDDEPPTQAPDPPPIPPSVSIPLPLSGFILQPTTGQHDEGDFIRLRPSENPNPFDYADIKVSMDELSSALKVNIEFKIYEEGISGIAHVSYFIASGNPQKLNGIDGLYFFEQPEFIYECGQSVAFEKSSFINAQLYQVTIDSQIIDDKQCLINYLQTDPINSFLIEIETKDGLVTSVSNLDTGLVYNVVDKSYSPF